MSRGPVARPLVSDAAQALTEALVAAAQPDEDRYRHDATPMVIVRA
ncbi:hypothetical protein [Streptomyces tremellae]|uniref:Uncharacterized protein n=1 Tax=Streptomyces tremellae TaxID=1124239 RepID=A0ABP7EHP9_9ACTN